MSDSGRVKRDKTDLVKWSLAALSAVIVLSVIGYGLTQQSAYSQSAANRSANYSENAAAQINQSCVDVIGIEKSACIKQAATEYRLQARDKQREYDDLAAQQTSALWTSIMGIAALIGMGLSAVGVFLVYTTFQATKESNKISKRVVAALVTVDRVILSYLWEQTPSIILQWKNHHTTEALNFRADIELIFRTNEGAVVESIRYPERNADGSDSNRASITKVTREHIDAFQATGEEIVVNINFRYQTIFGDMEKGTASFSTTDVMHNPGNMVIITMNPAG